MSVEYGRRRPRIRSSAAHSSAVRWFLGAPWTWIASRKVRSATSDRSPKEKGRETSAGKAGMSNCVAEMGARSCWARGRRKNAAVARSAIASTSAVRGASKGRALTTMDASFAGRVGRCNKVDWPAGRAGDARGATKGSPLEVHVVHVVGRFAARVVWAHRTGRVHPHWKGARGGLLRTGVERGVVVDVADGEARPVLPAAA